MGRREGRERERNNKGKRADGVREGGRGEESPEGI